MDSFEVNWVAEGDTYRLIQNTGTGIVAQGETGWTDYTVSTSMAPLLSESVALLAAVGGLRRYVALLLDADHRVRIVEQIDSVRRILFELDANWSFGERYAVSLTVSSNLVSANFAGSSCRPVAASRSLGGAIGLLVASGNAGFGVVKVHPQR